MASSSAGCVVRTRPISAPSMGERTGRSPPLTTSLARPSVSRSSVAVIWSSPVRFAWPVSGDLICRGGSFARLPRLHDTGLLDDLRDQLLLAIGHDVHAGHARDFPDLLNKLDAQPLALGLLVRRPFEPRNRRIGNMNPGHMRPHPLRRTRRSQRPDPGQNKAFLMKPEVARARHETLEHRQVEAVLGLDELSPGGDLLAHMQS